MLAKNARKSEEFAIAPFRHSGTKNRVIGLENSGVEWVQTSEFSVGKRDWRMSHVLHDVCVFV
jgi:hypothetical protein